MIDDMIYYGIKSTVKSIIESAPKVLSYYFGGLAAVGVGNYGYKKIKNKIYFGRLDKRINDIYNPKNMTKHCWISGVQGSGKSNKLRRIFINTFIKQGWGGIYIDTHGTADEVLLSIPPNRWKDVIYIAPFMKKCYGTNVLQRYSYDDSGEIDRVAEDVVDIFSKMYPRSWGDKLANTIRFAVKAVLIAEENNKNYNNPTLVDVYKLLNDGIFREEIMEYVDNEIIVEFFKMLKPSSALNKLENPLSSNNILAYLCQEDGIDFLHAINNKKIIICNFDYNYLSNNANLMAAMTISIIAKCAAKRKEDDEVKSPYFAIAADEFYEYANRHISYLIAQMRKKNICMLLANQYRDQVPKDVQSAISMCQYKFIHTPADADVNWIANIYKDYFTKEEIIKIPFYHCIHDEHNPKKSRAPYITPTPMYRGDYNWEYVHKLKFASLHYAPYKNKVIEEINKKYEAKTIKKVENKNTDNAIPIGEIFYDGEIDYE